MRVRTPSVRAGVGVRVGMLLLGFVLVNAVESAAEHPNASTTSQARLLSSTVVLEYECGDLKTCAHINDGQCDDGGPSAIYWACPRFSDATDCGTLCDQHAGSLPPPPPSCELKQWASTAESSSYYNEHYTATQAGLTLALTATAPTDLTVVYASPLGAQPPSASCACRLVRSSVSLIPTPRVYTAGDRRAVEPAHLHDDHRANGGRIMVAAQHERRRQLAAHALRAGKPCSGHWNPRLAGRIPGRSCPATSHVSALPWWTGGTSHRLFTPPSARANPDPNPDH